MAIWRNALTLAGLAGLGALAWLGLQDGQFPLFHSLAELFSIVVAVAIFMMAWNARHIMGNSFLLFIGIAYLAVAALDLMHTLTYWGLGIIALPDADVPTQLWIAGRYLQALSLLIAPVFLTRRLRWPQAALMGYVLLGAVVLASILVWDLFPTSYRGIPGAGGHQTPFKIISEYVICGILAGALVFLLRRRARLSGRVASLIAGSIVLTILSELAFTQYVHVYGPANVVGHMLKIVAVYLIYRAVIVTGLTQPYELLFHDLKRSQDALRAGEARLRRLVDANIIGVITTLGDGQLRRINEAFARMLGYSRQELETGQVHWTDLTPPEYLSLDEQAVAECRTRGTVAPYQKEYLHRDGQRVPVMIGFTRLEEADEAEFIAFVVDLTEQKQAERALLEANQRTRGIIEGISDAFVSMDRQWRCTYVNEAAATLLGKTRQEMLHQNLWDVFPHAEQTGYPAKLRQAMQDGVRVDFEAFSERMGLWLDCHCYPTPEGLSVFFADTTERRKAQEQLQRVANELARSNHDLEQFAYVASHDLQEPLRMVNGYMSLLQRRYTDRLDATANEFIGFAVDGAQRMQTLIQDLLAYSRVGTSGKAFATVDANEVLGRALGNLQAAIAESDARITRDPLPTLQADPTQLLQLLQNLLANAIKFRTDSPPHIHVSARRGAGEWVFSVRDNGIGIEPQHTERIFLIFQRLHGRGEYAGTGIGLAVCKRIVDRHGGRIWVESAPGQGSTFHFTLADQLQAQTTAPQPV